MLSILFYSKATGKVKKRIEEIITEQARGKQIEIYRNIESLSNRLYLPRGDLSIIFLHIVNREDLLDILLIRNLFYDIPIVLMLPDRKSDTVSKGHKLYPRFIGYSDSNFEDLAAVFGKILKKVKN